MTEQPRHPQINWTQVLGGALAAVSSAVLLSTVGVAGTIIGAALGSVAVTLGSAIYSYYLAATRRRLAKVHDQALTRVVRARASVGGARDSAGGGRDSVDGSALGAGHDPHRAEENLAAAAGQLEQARQELADEAPEARRVMWRELLGGLRWRRIALAAGGIFLLAVAIITAFELLSGRELSSFTGGTSQDQGPRTSIVGLVEGGGGKSPSPSPSHTPGRSPSGNGGQVPAPGTGTGPTPTGTSTGTSTGQPTPGSGSTGTPTPTGQPSSAPTTPAPTPHNSTPSAPVPTTPPTP